MYKVFYYHKVIILSGEQEDVQEAPGDVVVRDYGKEAVKEAIASFFQNTAARRMLIVSADVYELFGMFSSLFTSLDAAGGLVFGPENQLLFIKRFGLWDFPKGKVERGESALNAALREVAEETGIRASIENQEPLLTYHMYHQHSKTILKTTYWYVMKASGREALKPQYEEQIEEARWVPFEEAKAYLANSYASMQDLFMRYQRVMKS